MRHGTVHMVPDIPPLKTQQLWDADREVLAYFCRKTGTFYFVSEAAPIRVIKNTDRQSLRVLFQDSVDIFDMSH